MSLLDHEKLDVYQAAIDLVVLRDGIIEHLPRGRGYLADQLQRVALSGMGTGTKPILHFNCV